MTIGRPKLAEVCVFGGGEGVWVMMYVHSSIANRACDELRHYPWGGRKGEREEKKEGGREKRKRERERERERGETEIQC